MENKPAKNRIHPLSIVAAILFAAALLGLVYLILQLTNPAPNVPGEVPTAKLTLIPAPTHTHTPPPTSIISTAIPTPGAVLPPGTIGVGAYVKVGRTQGAGLRMRAEPGTDAAVDFVAMDDEVFLVVGGPVEADGYTWWQLSAPYDQTRTGWSAQDFLDLIELATPTP